MPHEPTNRPIDPAIAAATTGPFVDQRAVTPSPRKRRRRQSAPPPIVEDECYSITTFCKAHKISESFYFKLKGLGLGPATMKVGSRVLITREAARAWRRRRATVST